MYLKIQDNVSLKNFNSFRFNINAKSFCIFSDISHLDILIDEIKNYNNCLFLGQGSNIVFSKDYEGLVIHIATKGINIKEYKNEIFLRVSAGEIWDDFVKYTLNNFWYGLENLVAIPGTVGACPIQNVGAYGVEVKDYINKVYCIDIKNKEEVILGNEECRFFYRDSIFKTDFGKDLFILEVEFKLNKKFNPNLSYEGIKESYYKRYNTRKIDPILLSNMITNIRLEKLPDYSIKGNVGSFFKNPIITTSNLRFLKERYPDLVFYPLNNNMVKIAAAWLIDKLDLKNYSQGNIKVHDKQALVIINDGKGSPDDLIKLKKHIQDEVYKNFHLRLEPEPIFV